MSVVRFDLKGLNYLRCAPFQAPSISSHYFCLKKTAVNFRSVSTRQRGVSRRGLMVKLTESFRHALKIAALPTGTVLVSARSHRLDPLFEISHRPSRVLLLWNRGAA